MTSISAVLVGGGGSGAYDGVYDAGGAGGGGLRYINNLPVSPGQQWTVVVGAGGIITDFTSGKKPGPAGGNSIIRRAADNAIAVQANGGGGAPSYATTGERGGFATGGTGSAIGTGALGGTIGGGNGGNGGGTNNSRAPGAGGAAGYSGNGGNGGTWVFSTQTLPTAGSGGGGGGSFGNGASSSTGSGAGGVGIFGQGANGAAGTSQAYRYGYGGSGGSDGIDRTNTGIPTGGAYGGAGATTLTSSGAISNTLAIDLSGGSGAVRIIWGPGKSFPSNAA